MNLLFVTNADNLSREELIDVIANQLEDSQIVFGSDFDSGMIGATFTQPASDTPILIKILEENGFRVFVDEAKRIIVVNATNNRPINRANKYATNINNLIKRATQ